jgi:hypothetical protein
MQCIERNEQKRCLAERLGIDPLDDVDDAANREIAIAAMQWTPIGGKLVSRNTAKIARMIMAEARRLDIEPAKVHFSSLGISEEEKMEFIQEVDGL